MVKYEHSFGIVPVKRLNESWSLLLVQHHAGHWAFPKGHAEQEETPQQTAERELFEETGLKVELYLLDSPLTESYFFTFKGQKIYKKVSYYVAQVKGQVKIQESEIQSSQWFPIEQAASQITFPEGQKICGQVQQILALLPPAF